MIGAKLRFMKQPKWQWTEPDGANSRLAPTVKRPWKNDDDDDHV